MDVNAVALDLGASSTRQGSGHERATTTPHPELRHRAIAFSFEEKMWVNTLGRTYLPGGTLQW
jgi:hypothetical protein